MSVVILQDEIVHYEVLGRGRPVIFLHGWVGSWRYWIPAMQAISVNYRAYALDLWGFGDTNKVLEKYTIQQQANLVMDFMEKLGITKTAIIGHGLGSVISVTFSSSHPEMVDRLMPVCLPFNESMISQRLLSIDPSEVSGWLLARVPSNEAARMEAPKTDTRAVETSLANLQNLDLAGLSQHLNTACLYVHGQNDPAVFIPPVEYLDQLPAQSHYILFEQSAHFPMLEETSKFNRLLCDFLGLPSGESPRQLQIKEEWKRRVR
ncbi:MAG: alpha/beta fold hydrolase [Omnitrophica WOR_2 bacterium]